MLVIGLVSSPFPSFSVNMEDLREVTHSKHFEQYRRKRLEEMGFADDHG